MCYHCHSIGFMFAAISAGKVDVIHELDLNINEAVDAFIRFVNETQMVSYHALYG